MAELDLPLGEAQQMLRDSVQRFLADNERPGWRELSETLGLAGIALPENVGGFGGGMIDIAVVMAELGPALAGADWLSHVAATSVLARVAPEYPALSDLATGSRRIAIICAASTAAMPAVEDGLVRGSAALVAGAAEADLLLVASDEALLLVGADGDKVEQRHRIMHDGSVSADLAFTLKPGDAALLASGEAARAWGDHANDLILAGRCAEAVGLMQRMIADCIDYLGQRTQFGSPIGRFQSLRHRAADMQLAAMKAAALTETAILAVDQDRADRAQTVSAACVEVGDAVRIVGESAVQIHGAMGLTEELSLGGHFKRALAITAAFGPCVDHLARFSGRAS
ncbi:alkylation response protein AidB-like acyl-CoA dehydrogenase [Sphingopyxis sp. OAS728]|uniref:acyl-CoA dehydrogenase family protein n=1 Tax=Sphingopyxis sp. OAS728 TaxID=2663823 RepID=UPI00178AB1AC|nr:acyl-CoA dehydrogenase family protein [Sphingopyxis sp. OAS728]MBE1530042.1 alkylation response protein AidB-like acyl-CoA dehydrogenase [Sphingopyxis sp. OAS728]